MGTGRDSMPFCLSLPFPLSRQHLGYLYLGYKFCNPAGSWTLRGKLPHGLLPGIVETMETRMKKLYNCGILEAPIWFRSSVLSFLILGSRA